MKIDSNNSFKSLTNLKVDGKIYKIFSLKKAEQSGLEGISSLPKSLKILLENLLRFEDNQTVKGEQIQAIKEWLKNKSSRAEIALDLQEFLCKIILVFLQLQILLLCGMR